MRDMEEENQVRDMEEMKNEIATLRDKVEVMC